MRKRMLAAALACALLTGCGPVRTEPLEQEVARADAPVIAYVPLDDRPDNAERVVYLAESLGYELAMPERDLYRTRLDGQPLNENGTQYGDRGALYEWVAAQEAAGCDRYILSVDQLLSGGLVSSRAMTGENPVTLSTGETLTETELLAAVIDLLAADADNRVWLLDTVMRLAATTGYGGFGLNEYNALRSYGMAPRPHLEGADLTIENIVADYALGADGTPVPVEAEEPLPEGAVADYLAARERKLRLSDEMFRCLEGTAEGQFRVLVGIDDSSEEDSIQKNEIAYLRAQLREGDALLSGVDDLAFKAVTKLYLEESGWDGAAVSVQYFGGTEDQPACAYDYQPLEVIMAEHFDFFGLTAAEPGAEELQGNADNFWTPDIDREAVLDRLETGMAEAAAPVIENLERSNFISALPPAEEYAERGWGGVALEDYSFPWDRAFEIGMEIRLGDFTEPHESFLGVYYK